MCVIVIDVIGTKIFLCIYFTCVERFQYLSNWIKLLTTTNHSNFVKIYTPQETPVKPSQCVVVLYVTFFLCYPSGYTQCRVLRSARHLQPLRHVALPLKSHQWYFKLWWSGLKALISSYAVFQIVWPESEFHIITVLWCILKHFINIVCIIILNIV
jgi:hypothetical protein